MIPQPPPGQGPIDPHAAFTPPDGSGAQPNSPPPRPPGGFMPPPFPPGMFPPPPPMMYPPSFGQRPQRSFARGIFMTLATTIFGLSLAMNVYLLLFSGAMSAGGTKQDAVQAGDPDQQIAVYPLRGIIGPEQVALFEKYLSAAEKDANIKAVVLDIDTPGGDVTASDELYDRIKRFKETKKVPVVVTMGGLATSGGYYIACAADYVYAQQTTITGNIGVIWPRYNVSELAQKWGVKETTIASDKTPFKNAGSMFQPEAEQDVQYLKGLINFAYDRFTVVVKEGRGSRLKNPDGSTPRGDISQIANGKAYTSAEALALGLVDKIGYATDAYAYAANKAGLTKPHVVRYTRLPTLFEAFGATSNVAPPSAESAANGGKVTVNGVNVNVDRNLIQELATPRMMYLWRGE